MGPAVAGEANRSMRGKGEVHALADSQIRKPTGLREGDPEFETRQVLLQQDGRVGTVEQKTLYRAGIMSVILRKLCRIALEDGCLGADESFHVRPLCYGAAQLGTYGPTIRGFDLPYGAVGALQSPEDPIVGTDEPCDEGGCRVVVELLWSPELLEAAVIHHCDVI